MSESSTNRQYIREQKFSKMLRNTEVESVDNIRDIYDDALRYNFKSSEAPLELQEEKIDRIMVNQIRHKKSTYMRNLWYANRMPNKTYYKRFKNVVLTQISYKYPFLSDECDRQKRKVPMVTKIQHGGE